MDKILHIIFVVIVNIIAWGMIVGGVVGFFAVMWAMITGKGPGRLPWL